MYLKIDWIWPWHWRRSRLGLLYCRSWWRSPRSVDPPPAVKGRSVGGAGCWPVTAWLSELDFSCSNHSSVPFKRKSKTCFIWIVYLHVSVVIANEKYHWFNEVSMVTIYTFFLLRCFTNFIDSERNLLKTYNYTHPTFDLFTRYEPFFWHLQWYVCQMHFGNDSRYMTRFHNDSFIFQFQNFTLQ